MPILLDDIDLSTKYPPVHLRSNRFFYVDPIALDTPAGWYLKVRGPRCFGPFQSKEEAGNALDQIICGYLSSNDSSRR